MDKNIHNEDDLFKKAYQHLEEKPSPEVWNNINAELDKRDAVYYRKKFVEWRLVAVLLLLLFTGILAYYLVYKSPEQTVALVTNNKVVVNPAKQSKKPEIDNEVKSVNSTNNGSFKVSKYAKTIAVNRTLLHTGESNSNNYNKKYSKNKKQQTEQAIDSSAGKYVRRNSQSVLPWVKDNHNEINQQKRQAFLALGMKEKAEKPVNDKLLSDSLSKDIIVANEIKTRQQKAADELAETIALATNNDTTAKKDNLTIAKSNRNKKDKKHNLSFWTFTPYASADFTHYKLDNDEIDNSAEPEEKGDIKEREKHEFSYSAGVMAKLQFKGKTGVKTGIGYSRIVIGIQPQTLYASSNGSQGVSYKYITSSGYAFVNTKNDGITPLPGDSISSTIAQHHLQFLNIPVYLTYKLYNNKFVSVDVAAGVAANLLLSTAVRTEVKESLNKESVYIHKLQGLRSSYYSFVTDANIQFHVNKHTDFTFIPSFKYAITAITKNNVVKTFPYSFGMGLGITYRF